MTEAAGDAVLNALCSEFRRDRHGVRRAAGAVTFLRGDGSDFCVRSNG